MLVVLTTFLFGRYMLYKMRQSAAGNAACVVASHDRHTRTGSFFPKNGNVYRLLLNPTKTFCSGAEQYTKAFVVDQASPSASETEQTTHWMTAIFQEKGKPLEEDSVELHEQLLHIGDVIVVKQNQCFPCDGFMLRTTVKRFNYLQENSVFIYVDYTLCRRKQTPFLASLKTLSPDF